MAKIILVMFKKFLIETMKFIGTLLLLGTLLCTVFGIILTILSSIGWCIGLSHCILDGSEESLGFWGSGMALSIPAIAIGYIIIIFKEIIKTIKKCYKGAKEECTKK